MNQRVLAAITGLVLCVLAAVPAYPASAAPLQPSPPPPPNVDVSRRAGNESEVAIAVNPTNPNNIVMFANIAEGVAGMFLAVSFDGGQTWNRRIVGAGSDIFGDTCCDPSLSFDEYGNLFLTYLYNVEITVPVALSTDGGLTFNVIANIAKPAGSTSVQAAGGERGLFRFVDQPTITRPRMGPCGWCLTPAGRCLPPEHLCLAWARWARWRGAGDPRHEQLHLWRHRDRPAGPGDAVVLAHRVRTRGWQGVCQRRPRWPGPGALWRPCVRGRDPRRGVRLYSPAAGSLGRRRVRTGLESQRRALSRPGLCCVYGRTEEREQRHRHLCGAFGRRPKQTRNSSRNSRRSSHPS